jgi:antitoxin (DNA-binding transcriptional repressor) of toxin-antitoxin stability system
MPGRVFNLYEAKTALSSLVDRAAEGEVIYIAKAGKVKAKLVPTGAPRKRRRPGGWERKVTIAPDFDAPLPPTIRAGFEGRSRGRR